MKQEPEIVYEAQIMSIIKSLNPQFVVMEDTLVFCILCAQCHLSVIIVKAIFHIFLINGQNRGFEVLCRVT